MVEYPFSWLLIVEHVHEIYTGVTGFWGDVGICQQLEHVAKCCSYLLHSGEAIHCTWFYENAFKQKLIYFIVVFVIFSPCSVFFLNRAFTFDSVQSAQRAKASLNGADIYSGCCTLKIEYAKVEFLSLPYPYKQIQSERKCNFWV